MVKEEMNSLAELQAFVDLALENPARRHDNKGNSPDANLPQYVERMERSGCLRSTFLREAVRNSTEYRALAASLRRAETYGIVSFLLKENSEHESISGLSSRYGVSPSHFRRLFRKSVGIAPKSAMRAWRMASVVLAIVDSRRPITEVAIEYGYASPSHFSKEFRDAVGRSLTDVFGMKDRAGSQE
ncbi:AraC-type DNA-binding protein [Cupriavidus sp. YR651]|uniref:helix-turn-helix domain-containing protein n=1 Tax=Cupriavidus sp. YR651 TaxID=1855315 RepID=UPI000887275C|nr:helix-turn-helix domain-containing protein [Cupriavidus sp. YR651]SDD38841.1 AraC-type DNA-binding protein [Cupriavidus sp. YR651]